MLGVFWWTKTLTFLEWTISIPEMQLWTSITTSWQRLMTIDLNLLLTLRWVSLEFSKIMPCFVWIYSPNSTVSLSKLTKVHNCIDISFLDFLWGGAGATYFWTDTGADTFSCLYGSFPSIKRSQFWDDSYPKVRPFGWISWA